MASKPLVKHPPRMTVVVAIEALQPQAISTHWSAVGATAASYFLRATRTLCSKRVIVRRMTLELTAHLPLMVQQVAISLSHSTIAPLPAMQVAIGASQMAMELHPLAASEASLSVLEAIGALQAMVHHHFW